MRVFIASPWRNKESVKQLSDGLRALGHEVYSFLESGSNLMTGNPIEQEMQMFETALKNWKNDPHIAQIFESEMKGLKESDIVVLLGPPGSSSLLEAGVAHGLGKKTYYVGSISKPEVVYLVFDKIYHDIETFLVDVPNL